METEIKYLVNREMAEIEKEVKDIYENLRYIQELYLPAIYYDTRSGNIANNKAALRVRKESGQWIGCYKATTGEERRFIEEEVELSEQDLDSEDWISSLQHYSDLIKIASEEEIEPKLKIDTRRKVYELTYKNMLLEIVFDWVDYLEGLKQEERVEVELKKGDYKDFNIFVQNFEEEIKGLKETQISKYQRARELLNTSA